MVLFPSSKASAVEVNERVDCTFASQVEAGGPQSEDYKAQVFVSVLKDLNRIGVPYRATGEGGVLGGGGGCSGGVSFISVVSQPFGTVLIMVV